MEDYINNYKNFQKNIVYDFKFGFGGIGDCIKFFMYALSLCIKYNIKLYYLKNDNPIEKYLQMKYSEMYITSDTIVERTNISINDIQNINTDVYNIVTPFTFYDVFNYDDITLPFESVFNFSDEIKKNADILLLKNVDSYISINLRLGDKYLETEKQFVVCPNDSRVYNEENIFKFIEDNRDKNVVYFCDNNNYKIKIKNNYNNIIITNCNIGHTSLLNTTSKQTLDAITEFYLLCNSEKIFIASESGFSRMASKFRNIPIINI